MRTLLATIVMLVVLYPQSSVAGCGMNTRPSIDRSTFTVPSEVRWQDLDRGRSEARARRVPMLVHLSFGTQCEHCRDLEQLVFSDPGVRDALNSDQRVVVPVEIPLWAMTAAERAFGEQLGYGEDCLLAVVDADGRVLETTSGQRALTTRGLPQPEAFLKALEALAGSAG